MTLLAPPPPAPEIEQGVIEEAQRRQRHRRSAIAVIALGAAVLALGVDLGLRGSSHSARRPQRSASNALPSAAQDASKIFSQEPDMGVACHVPNSIACDRVGLAVSLRRPAVAVSATVAGSPLKLDDRAWRGPTHNGRRTLFVGFLQPAGRFHGPLRGRADGGRYRWIGSHPLFARVQIVADYGHGEAASATVRVQVRAGWG